MDISKATYVGFPDFDRVADWRVSGNTLTEYRKFLEEHSGVEDWDWAWSRGDRFARGVYINEEAVAVLFKLKFDLS